MTNSDLSNGTEGGVDVLAPANALAEGTLRIVSAGESANSALREIDAGTAWPDDLADRLIALLDGIDAQRISEVIRGFMRPIAKRIEARSTPTVPVAGVE
ncbi:hypothetical protein [Paraburkholderia phenazinium]|uniref:Uncharacterized protein n=1 Tax=Paraburkholderia phenazinium TaxID=60549 RepID=A0A1G8FKD7_9BURK|nr:hypothetical protein [Paraburkholderia phenazinium]SDH82600.1 hypothetical protein SAMN05216466_113223 [Paraburkholderia phenazinium]